MNEPFYFTDEKELFAKIFEISEELTRSLKMARQDADVHPQKRKSRRDAGPRNADLGEGRTHSIPN